jgi:hypothetical protein
MCGVSSVYQRSAHAPPRVLTLLLLLHLPPLCQDMRSAGYSARLDNFAVTASTLMTSIQDLANGCPHPPISASSQAHRSKKHVHATTPHVFSTLARHSSFERLQSAW